MGRTGQRKSSQPRWEDRGGLGQRWGCALGGLVTDETWSSVGLACRKDEGWGSDMDTPKGLVPWRPSPRFGPDGFPFLVLLEGAGLRRHGLPES